MDESKALEIYKMIKGEETMWLNLHRQYSQQYFTLIAAIFATSLLATYHFRGEPWLTLIVLIAPIVNILLSVTAIRMCNRFYQRFLEGITIQAKLEPLIGLTGPRPDEIEASRSFPEDKHILPERWLTGRKQGKAADFVQQKMGGGSNRLVQASFYLLLVANVAVASLIVINVVCAFAKGD